MPYIDLHVHSDKSDGTYAPAALVPLAKAAGLSAFALTDHDTVAGVAEAREAGLAAGIRVIAGVELSAVYGGKEIHIVGLGVDDTSEELLAAMARYREARDARNEQMVTLMQKQGIPVTVKKLRERFPDSVITRAHCARFLMETGYVRTIPEAFERYVGEGCPCYVPKKFLTFEQALSLIAKSGGRPVLAHPFQYGFSDRELRELIFAGKNIGLQGVEALYPTHSPEQTKRIRTLAAEAGLFVSGGSDFHGSNKPLISIGVGFGNLRIPESLLEHIF